MTPLFKTTNWRLELYVKAEQKNHLQQTTHF